MKNNLTRRKFIASTSAVLAASQLPGVAQDTNAGKSAKLALDGGEKAVTKALPKLKRWGEPERERLNAMLEQDTLFYWKGPQTTLLTERFQKLYPLKYVMPCSSGTASLHIAIAAAGIAPGDEVITTPITDMGTVIGVLFQQAVPVFADLEPDTYNLDPSDVEKRITPKTKAIIAVHLAGNPASMTRLKTLADKYNLVLIEDCAQAWGTKYQGKPVGTIGHIACYSLQNSKHITCGDGGIVATSDERFGPLLQKFGDKGFNRFNSSYTFDVLAANYRMSEPQAAVAAAQMTRMSDITERRSQLGNLLTREISGLAGIQPHHVSAGDLCSYWFYMLRMEPKKFRCKRDDFVKALRAEGVQASAGYIPSVLYQMDLFKKHTFFAGRWPVKEMGLTAMDYSKVSCPESEAILDTSIRVVIHEGMDEEYIQSVGKAFRKVARHFAA